MQKCEMKYCFKDFYNTGVILLLKSLEIWPFYRETDNWICHRSIFYEDDFIHCYELVR